MHLSSEFGYVLFEEKGKVLNFGLLKALQITLAQVHFPQIKLG